MKNCEGGKVWTAGQRRLVDANSEFVWKVKSKRLGVHGMYDMPYQNWARNEPNYYKNNDKACMAMSSETNSDWTEVKCSELLCSLCQVSIAS